MLANSYVKNEGLYIMEVCQVKYWLIATLKIVSFIYLFILFYFIFLQMKVSKLFQVFNYFLRCLQSPIPHVPNCYKEESHEDGSKMLTKGFEPKIS